MQVVNILHVSFFSEVVLFPRRPLSEMEVCMRFPISMILGTSDSIKLITTNQLMEVRKFQSNFRKEGNIILAIILTKSIDISASRVWLVR